MTAPLSPAAALTAEEAAPDPSPEEQAVIDRSGIFEAEERAAASHAVLGEVAAERARQDEKWGEQNHPDVAPEAVDEDATLASVFAHYELPFVADVKAYVDRAAERGQSSWVGIALEELTEALEAAALLDGTQRSEHRLRTEVIQLAAVCVQWAQAIDRRPR